MIWYDMIWYDINIFYLPANLLVASDQFLTRNVFSIHFTICTRVEYNWEMQKAPDQNQIEFLGLIVNCFKIHDQGDRIG